MKTPIELRRSALAASLTLLTAAAAIAAVRAAQTHLAYVDGYTGTADAYRVWHAGASKAPAPFLPLSPGDRITILRPSDPHTGASMLTVIVGGTSYRIDAAHSPFCIGPRVAPCVANAAISSNAVSSALTNILASVAPIFGRAHDGYYAAQHDRLTSRAALAPPSIPLLATAPTALAPIGDTTITIAWIDGVPPFQVTLADGTKTVVRGGGVGQDSIKITGLHLTKGVHYTFEVTDGNGHTALGRFVGTDQTPDLSAALSEIEDSGVPADVRSDLHAALLMRGGPQWYLDAYQTVVNTGDPKHLGNLLVRGGKTT